MHAAVPVGPGELRVDEIALLALAVVLDPVGEQVLRWLAFFSCSLLAYEVGDNPTVRTRAPWGDPPLGIPPFLPSPSFSRMPAPG